jgi:hypothetical protein
MENLSVRYTVQLTDTGQDFVIPADSLKTPKPGFSWVQVSTCSYVVNFAIYSQRTTFPETTVVWLDSVRLIVISAGQLMQK